jgi:hypothetical protein
MGSRQNNVINLFTKGIRSSINTLIIANAGGSEVSARIIWVFFTIVYQMSSGPEL